MTYKRERRLPQQRGALESRPQQTQDATRQLPGLLSIRCALLAVRASHEASHTQSR